MATAAFCRYENPDPVAYAFFKRHITAVPAACSVLCDNNTHWVTHESDSVEHKRWDCSKQNVTTFFSPRKQKCNCILRYNWTRLGTINYRRLFKTDIWNIYPTTGGQKEAHVLRWVKRMVLFNNSARSCSEICSLVFKSTLILDHCSCSKRFMTTPTVKSDVQIKENVVKLSKGSVFDAACLYLSAGRPMTNRLLLSFQ